MFESKLPDVGTTIFSEMTALALECGAINLAQGFPDYMPDARLVQAAIRALEGGAHQYAPMPGHMPLRECVATKYRMLYGLDIDPAHEVTITPGATAALATAIATIVRSGDEVIIFTPAYDSYAPAIRLCGGIVKEAPLHAPSYKPDWNLVRSLIGEKTALIVINSPHNPTGSMWTADDMKELALALEGTRAIVLSDEVYDALTFDGRNHISALAVPELRHRSYVVTSFGKTCHVTGWKVGACVATAQLSNEFRKAHQFVNFSVNTPAQIALAEYLSDGEAYGNLAMFFQARRDLFTSLLLGSNWVVRECHGSYFQLLGYENFSDESDRALAVRLTREHGVASIPLSPFGATDTALRFCFAKKEETLRAAAERLVKASF